MLRPLPVSALVPRSSQVKHGIVVDAVALKVLLLAGFFVVAHLQQFSWPGERGQLK